MHNEETAIQPATPADAWLQLTGEEPIRELTQIPAPMAAELLELFAPYIQQVRQYAIMAREINVTDENDTAGMAEARRLRLALVKVRTAAEKEREEQKRGFTVAGRVIDWLGNKNVRDEAQRAEDHLKAQETFAERMEAERRQAIAAARLEILRPIADDLTGIDLAEMTDEAFERLRAGFQAAHDAAEAQEAERKRLADAERERVAAIEAENERLRAEIAERGLPDPGLWPMTDTNTIEPPAPPATPDEVVITVYADGDPSVGIPGIMVNTIIPGDLWAGLSAGERGEMTTDILNAIGPWLDDKARVRVDAGSYLV